MKKAFIIVFYLLIALLSTVILFFAISTVLNFRPDEIKEIATEQKPDILPDTLSVMTWNIGYAGLGDNMDFFMDGGEKVRDTRERTEKNLQNIISEMKKVCADIYFIQEIDKKAHRSYGINEIEAIRNAFPSYHIYYAENFKSWFVPVPLREPIGRVDAGLVILSKYKPKKVVRFQYPSKFPYPVSLFNLKRALLSAYFITSDGREIMFGNTHCTAYDTGGMRQQEAEFLKTMYSDMSGEKVAFIVGGDWNQYPPEYKPSKKETDNKYFSPVALDVSGVEKYGRVVSDLKNHTARYNDFIYSESSTKTLLDFFFVSNDIEVSMVKCVDLNYHSSDHNPVVINIVL